MPKDIEVFKGYSIEILQDEDAENPRTEWDNFGTMVCFHRNYNLGDKHNLRSDDFEGWKEMMDSLRESESDIFLPLFLYDHSGITIRTDASAFRAFDSAQWDWGCVGFIYATASTIRKEYSVKRITKKIRERALALLESEVKTYDTYLTGDVWGYVIKDETGEVVDSLWGMFEHDYCEREARLAVSSIRKRRAREIREARKQEREALQFERNAFAL